MSRNLPRRSTDSVRRSTASFSKSPQSDRTTGFRIFAASMRLSGRREPRNSATTCISGASGIGDSPYHSGSIHPNRRKLTRPLSSKTTPFLLEQLPLKLASVPRAARADLALVVDDTLPGHVRVEVQGRQAVPNHARRAVAQRPAQSDRRSPPAHKVSAAQCPRYGCTQARAPRFPSRRLHLRSTVPLSLRGLTEGR